MPLIEPTAPSNIVASLDKDIDEFFGLNRIGLSHQDKTACVLLCAEQPTKDGAELVSCLLNRITQNRSSLTDAGRSARGKETWRWQKNRKLGLANKSLEVRIERAIARLLNDDWVNQVPAASGLTKASEGRRSVDIIHRHNPREFTFIELKALRPGKRSGGQQTPLFAAMEVLKYGLLLLFCKKNREVLFPGGLERRPVLLASEVHLEVLATPNCYLQTRNRGPFGLAWLNRLIANGLKELNEYQKVTNCEDGARFDFSFKRFPESFVWADEDHHQLLTCEEKSPCWNNLRNRVWEAMEKREPAPLM